MMTLKNICQYRSLSFFFFLIPLLLFVLLLSIKIPISFSQIFRNPSIFLFIMIFGFFVFSFRLEGKYSWILGLCITAVVFVIPLSYLWTSGQSDSKVIAGLLPYKDGFYYYNGANDFLNGLPPDSRSSWHPQFTGFLSSLLLFSSNNLQLDLAFLVGATGFCCYLSARKVFEIFNAPAAAFYLTLIYFFIVGWLGYTATEILGLAIGCLGLILMIRAAQTLRTRDLIFGLSIMMLALIVRAGAFFIFPLLIL